MSLPAIALPGQYLGPASQYAPGPGTHIQDSHIYASLAGSVSTKAPPSSSSSTSNSAKPSSKRQSRPLPLLTITKPSTVSSPPAHTLGLLGSGYGAGSNVLPEVDSVVLARVTRLGPRFASCDILVVGDVVCREGFHGLVRKEDVRVFEKDRVKIEEAFRVGDLVRGVVISLGDQSNYYISTASNEYGVVMARSEEGNVMVPVSWKEFLDPKTGRKESRKVAKPF